MCLLGLRAVVNVADVTLSALVWLFSSMGIKSRCILQLLLVRMRHHTQNILGLKKESFEVIMKCMFTATKFINSQSMFKSVYEH